MRRRTRMAHPSRRPAGPSRALGLGRPVGACRPIALSGSSSRSPIDRPLQSPQRLAASSPASCPCHAQTECGVLFERLPRKKAEVLKDHDGLSRGRSTGSPSTRMTPDVNEASPSMHLTSVVLPHPEGPTMERTSFRLTTRLRSLKTTEFVRGKNFVACSIEMATPEVLTPCAGVLETCAACSPVGFIFVIGTPARSGVAWSIRCPILLRCCR